MKISNHNKPTSANATKLLAVVTALTVLFPQWFDSIPIEVAPTTKELIHWAFKGVDMCLILYAVFSKPSQHETYYR